MRLGAIQLNVHVPFTHINLSYTDIPTEAFTRHIDIVLIGNSDVIIYVSIDFTDNSTDAVIVVSYYYFV